MAYENKMIDTGLTGKLNYEIIESVFGQMSDGIWENSSKMQGYWRFGKAVLNEADNKVYIQISNQLYHCPNYSNKTITNKFISEFNLNHFDIKFWFANKLKTIVKAEIEDKHVGEWKRDCKEKLEYLGYTLQVTIADAYKAYDTLKERKLAGFAKTTTKKDSTVQIEQKEDKKFEINIIEGE